MPDPTDEPVRPPGAADAHVVGQVIRDRRTSLFVDPS
ncbi:MAG: hypothetical protein JWN97_1088, partial [Nocardioides sp.]|nr:hypothetical protein [Nocardioides sp.]